LKFVRPAENRSPIPALTANVCVAWLALAFSATSTNSSEDAPATGQFPGRCDISDGRPLILGAGAMAVTYRARDTILNSTVALKVIGRKLVENPTARARFLREARAAAQIQHPNVALVIHYGEQNGECFGAVAQMLFLSCRAQSRHLLLLEILKMRDSSTPLGMTKEENPA
jgi:hypothetical protein